MPSATDARRLLNEIEDRFEQPQWPEVRSWLQQQSSASRTVSRATLPSRLEELAGDDPVLSPGDVLPNALLLRAPTATLPAGSHYEGPVFALGDLVVEEGVRLASDLVVQGTLTWRGGSESHARNLSAATLRLEQAGIFDGGIWCERLEGGIPAGSRVRGILVVSGSALSLEIGQGAQIGGLSAPGNVQVGDQAQLSQLHAGGEVTVGAEARIGTLRGAALRIGPRSRIARAESGGPLVIGADAVVDSAEAAGDIHLERGARLTGHTLLSRNGDIYAAESGRWHGDGRHWFYRLPDGSLSPYERGARPEGSSVVALRTLTHTLWSQSARLSAAPAPVAPPAAESTPPPATGGARVIEAPDCAPAPAAEAAPAEDMLAEAAPPPEPLDEAPVEATGATVLDDDIAPAPAEEAIAPAPPEAAADAPAESPPSGATVIEEQPPAIGTLARPAKKPKSRRRR